MATRHWFTTVISTVHHDRLRQAVVAAGFVCEGTANDLTANSRVGLDLALATLSGPQQTQLQGIVDAHDGTDYIAMQWFAPTWIGVQAGNIDAKTVGNTFLGHTPGEKGRFTPVFAFVRLQAVAGLSSAPTVSVGTNAPDYNNIIANVALTAIVNLNQEARRDPIGTLVSAPPNTDVYFRVSIGAVATTYTLGARLVGFFDNGA